MDFNDLFQRAEVWVWVRRILLILLGANLPQLAMDASSLWAVG